jgi:TPR repeat protein
MKNNFVKYTLLLALMMTMITGCVVTGQIRERQATKAYLQKDYATAFTKYSDAAADGNDDAQYHLAVMYAEGEGVEKSLPKAAKLLQQAAAQDHSDAQLMLGLFNVYGDGVPTNPTKGAKLIAQAAESGNDVAMYYLGNLYAMGLGVKKDIPTALSWMKKAEDKGFPIKEELLTKKGLEDLYAD